VAQLFKRSELSNEQLLMNIGTRPERPFQILGVTVETTLGDLISNVVFLSTLKNQFDHARLHVKFRDARPFSREIISLSPWIDSAEPLPGEWPRFVLNRFPSIKLWRGVEIGHLKGKRSCLYDLIVTNQMALADLIHALPNPVPLRLPEAKAENLRNQLVNTGLRPDRWFATLHYRDNSYRYRPGGNDRDSDPEAFASLVDHIISLGGQVVRLGHPGMKAFRPQPGFVDLSLEPNNFLLQAAAVCHSRFMIAGPSGAIAVAWAFRVPNTLVDAVDTGVIWGEDIGSILTHEVITPRGERLRNQSLFEAGLLDRKLLIARMKVEAGFQIRKVTDKELKKVAIRLYEQTADCFGWRPPAMPVEGPKPNHILFPPVVTSPQPWFNL
jgi:putative glycosyltransferase (TIGR04372 family)